MGNVDKHSCESTFERAGGGRVEKLDIDEMFQSAHNNLTGHGTEDIMPR